MRPMGLMLGTWLFLTDVNEHQLILGISTTYHDNIGLVDGTRLRELVGFHGNIMKYSYGDITSNMFVVVCVCEN